ncbi:MAG: hypothetical protein OEU32_10290, partial [Acidimicrobiia bacterium]|nr:hypothetical protein [Acidimicrobiia bacterium]
HLVPAFYGIRGIREALLGDGGVRDVAGDTAIVAAFCLVLVPLATWVFTRSIATAKRAGTLGSY